MDTRLFDNVKAEIEGLHRFFVDWFGGSSKVDIFEQAFMRRFSEDLVFIPPSGRYLGLKELAYMVYSGHASNPDFRVQIRNVQVVREFDDQDSKFVLATYEEWQCNALASTPPDNARLSTVLFRVNKAEGSLTWLHIHETWMPEEVMQADAFDF